MLKRGLAAAGIPHLVGRDADLALLRRLLEAALQGRGSLILISGEAGIGKTSLAQALARHALDKGAIVALGRCYEGSAPAFGLWQDLLTELAVSAALDPAALPQPFGVAPPVQTAYQLMQSVVGALRSAAAAPKPAAGSPKPAAGSPKPAAGYPALVLLLDDVHWADRDSLELLDVVTRRLENASILIVVTYRSDDIHRHHPLFELLPTLQRDRPVESVGLRRLNRVPSGWQAGHTAALAHHFCAAEQWEKALQHSMAAGDAAVQTARQAGDPQLLAAGLWNLGRLCLVYGDLALAPRHLDEAERLARQEGDGTLLGRCLMEQARLSNWNGDYTRGARQAAEGLELARTGRDSLFLAGLCWILGIASGERGHYSQALDCCSGDLPTPQR